MKLAFAKEPYCAEYTWSSMKWQGAQALLDDWVFRSQNISLAVNYEADTWVLDSRTRIDDGWLQVLESRVPEDVDALYEAHEAVSVDSVPWGEYDVVITTDPIIPERIIKACPDTLFCYYECGHTTKSAWRSRHNPQGGYDLYLDHALLAGGNNNHMGWSRVVRLPQSVNFPYLVNPSIMQGLIDMPPRPNGILSTGKTSVPQDLFPSYRLVSGPHLKFFHRAVAQRETIPTAEWLQTVASCKYGVVLRGDRVIGQAAIEEAAMGLVVIGRGIYTGIVRDRSSALTPVMSWEAVRSCIDRFEQVPEFYDEAVNSQYGRLEDFFWDKPIGELEIALRMKRDH